MTIAGPVIACNHRERAKIHVAVDALGLPIRFSITPGQWDDCPQARGLIEGLSGVSHVIADAAYDADHLSAFIADDLGAKVQINQNRTRKPRDRSTGRSIKSGTWSSVSVLVSNASAGSPYAAKKPCRLCAPLSLSHAPRSGWPN